MNTFSENLKFLLQKNSVSQTELAKALDISAARLNQYLKGKAEASYDILVKLAVFFDTSADYMLGRKIGHICGRIQSDNFLFFDEKDNNSIIFTQNSDNLSPFIEKGDTVKATKGSKTGKPYVVTVKNGEFSVMERAKSGGITIEAEVVAVIKSFSAD